jgi:alpha-N-arabinofuranosidase
MILKIFVPTILFFIIITSEIYPKSQTAFVKLNFDEIARQEVSPLLFGNFIEYYMSFRNGFPGIWAQEFRNRGFDIKIKGLQVSPHWQRYISDGAENVQWEVKDGGYNKNALYFQRVIKFDDKGSAGVQQSIYNSSETGHIFYVYLRSTGDVRNVKIKVIHPDNYSVIKENSHGSAIDQWEKYTSYIPPVEGLNRVRIAICFEGTGTLDIDEASIMPANNVNGIRKEYYDLFKEWRPTAMRYPGGWFVEYSGYQWPMAVGEIDQRAVYEGYENVRLDFGLHEFISLCREIGAEPHITIYFLNGSPEKSAAIVEYCNGPADSHYGGMRSSHGHPQPYNVKLWEIGNEIWHDPENYGRGFVEYYKAMKEVDPTITGIISGDIWHGRPFVDTIFTEVGTDCDIYGWHWAQPSKEIEPATDEEKYLSQMCGNLVTENKIDSIFSWAADHGLEDHIEQAITEIWSEYDFNSYEWYPDTAVRGGSLENGLWMASQYNSVIRKSDKITLMEKTFSVHTLRCEKVNGRRIYYRTPSYLACRMVRNHVGNELIKTEVNCNTFDVPRVKWLFWQDDVPWLDVVATQSDDSLFINFLNKHPEDSMRTYINLKGKSGGKYCRKYILSSGDYLDANTAAEPNKITIEERKTPISTIYAFPPHSFTILAIPLNKLVSAGGPAGSDDIFRAGPNPFSDYINISLINSPSQYNIAFYDSRGRLVKRITTKKSPQRIDTGDLPAGAYFLRIITNTGTSTTPLIKVE